MNIFARGILGLNEINKVIFFKKLTLFLDWNKGRKMKVKFEKKGEPFIYLHNFCLSKKK